MMNKERQSMGPVRNECSPSIHLKNGENGAAQNMNLSILEKLGGVRSECSPSIYEEHQISTKIVRPAKEDGE